MSKKNARIIILIISLLLPYLKASASNDISFSHITGKDGLTSIPVTDILFDENGMVWISTGGGLYNYYGNSAHEVNFSSPESISRDILKLCTDRRGTLFGTGNNAVFALDLTTMEARILDDHGSRSMVYDESLIVASYDGNLRRIQDDRTVIIASFPESVGELSAVAVNKESIFVGTANGIVFRLLKDGREQKHWDCGSSVKSIYCDDDSNLWVSTLSDGLVRISGSGHISKFRHNPSDPNTISSDFVRCVCEDNFGHIWVGTFTGLNMIDRRTSNITRYFPDKNRQEALSNASILCLSMDEQGTIWAGTYFGGINYFNPEYEIFQKYTESDVEGEGLSSIVIGKVLEDTRGNIWIATEGGGLNMMDANTGRTRWWKRSGASGKLSSDNIKDMF